MRRTQPGGVCSEAQLAPREAAVELGVDVGDHVDAVDPEERVALEQPRGVDLGPLDLDPAHDHAGQVAADEPRPAELDIGERRSVRSSDPVKEAMGPMMPEVTDTRRTPGRWGSVRGRCG